MSDVKTLRDVAALRDAGFVIENPALDEVSARYAIAISPALTRLIPRDAPNDPIARQFVPDARELEQTPEESDDPIGDHAFSPVEGIVHRHADRVLLKIVSVCPVYCRFCFRRAMVGPGTGTGLTPAALERAVAYISSHPEIWEVILTGGDPFVLAPRRARAITRRLSSIAHVQIIRWHTRMPVADPAAVTGEFARAIRSETKAVYVALHANHPRELTEEARAACARIIDAGIPMLSQSVLLKGVNDDVDTLETLMRAFVAARIKPYYLHHCDRAPGTAHFRTSLARGQDLIQALRARLSGLAMPTYVLDIPGGHGKVPVGPSYSDDPPGQLVRDAEGRGHLYEG